MAIPVSWSLLGFINLGVMMVEVDLLRRVGDVSECVPLISFVHAKEPTFISDAVCYVTASQTYKKDKSCIYFVYMYCTGSIER